METSTYTNELGSPPQYTSSGYEHLKDEMEFSNTTGPQIQSTVVTIMPAGPPVRDHFVWSIFNAMYFNFCCLGVLALVFSVKSRDRKLLGDKSGATSYGSTARSLNIAATVLSIVFTIIAIIIIILQVTAFIRLGQESQHSHEPGNPFGYGNGYGN